MTVESTLSRSNEQIQLGRLWRAKEILSSSIHNYGYSRDIFHRLAEVLLSMGDDLEAGKYFLLSVDDPNERQLATIKLFLSRCNDFKDLMHKFPHAARVSRDAYPVFLNQVLDDLHAPAEFDTFTTTPILRRTTWLDRLFSIGCILVLFLLATCLTVGLWTILKWIWNSQL